MMKRGLRACFLLAAVGALGVFPVSAQRVPGAGRAQDRAQLEQRVRARFAETMQRRLRLTEEQSRGLEDVVKGLQADRMALERDEQALRQRMQAILADDQASEEEATQVLQRMVDLRAQEARLFQEEQDRLLEVLTPIQAVRFHAMREQLAQRIQQLRGGPAGMGRRPGGGLEQGPLFLPPPF